jgi:hemerythrin
MMALHSLKEWLLGHIVGSDRQLGEYIAQYREK